MGHIDPVMNAQKITFFVFVRRQSSPLRFMSLCTSRLVTHPALARVPLDIFASEDGLALGFLGRVCTCLKTFVMGQIESSKVVDSQNAFISEKVNVETLTLAVSLRKTFCLG